MQLHNETLAKDIKDSDICLVNGGRRNHDNFWFILVGHDVKVNEQTNEAKWKYKVPKVKKSSH